MLRSAGGLVLASASAGCLGVLDTDETQQPTAEPPAAETTTQKTPTATTPTQSPGVIRKLSGDGLTLQVTLSPSSGVATVNLLSPQGTAICRCQIAAGATTVTLPLLGWEDHIYDKQPLPAGIYSLVAANDATVVERQPIELSLSYTVATVSPIQSRIRLERQSATREFRTVTTDLAITLTNTGTAPLKLKRIRLPKGFPDPKPGSVTRADQQSGKWQNYIGMNRQATFNTTHSPLVYPGTVAGWTTDVPQWHPPINSARAKPQPRRSPSQ
jgi:hypothetical protein